MNVILMEVLQVIKVHCRYLSLSEIPNDMDLTAYREFVQPLDYDFSLERGTEYLVMAIIERKGTPWLYVVFGDECVELQIVPAVLFSFENFAFPSGMVVRMTNSSQPGLEILPASLSNIDTWFERYVEGDESVTEIIESEIKRLR